MAKQVKVLRVIAKREGFRRAGMEFGSVPTNLPLDSLSDDAHKAIKSEPNLVTFEVVMQLHEDGSLEDLPQTDVGELDKRKDELDAKAKQLDEYAATLHALEIQLKQRQESLDARDAALQAREAAVAEAEKAKAAAGGEAPKPKTGSK
ncbi:hypothetical protein [Ralstonia mannitolilytica]|uniref:hypothetical protein n=1 Tax=Ralstonia mannitolilytica TaxID=105219 RepID=UPI000CEDD1CD|nr:hypothetical protein [Ralstonia mannitolilytica]